MSHLVLLYGRHSRHKWDMPRTVSHLVLLYARHSRHKWDMVKGISGR